MRAFRACGSSLPAASGASQVVERNAIGDNGDLPATLTDLMRNSRTRYLEGSALIKAGESARPGLRSTRQST